MLVQELGRVIGIVRSRNCDTLLNVETVSGCYAVRVKETRLVELGDEAELVGRGARLALVLYNDRGSMRLLVTLGPH